MVDLVTTLLSFTAGSLLTMLAYTKGLQHNYNLKHDIEPKISNPIKDYVEVKKQKKDEEEAKQYINELLVDPRDEA
jgi:excinuclease UvrABC helicase subunit UvrB